MTEQTRYMVTEAMIVSRDWRRKQGPFFSVSEAAKFFFGMSASWLRLKLSDDDPEHPNTWFVHEDGTPVVPGRRNPEKADSARVFTLADIEPMAYSLFRLDPKFGRKRLGYILALVKAEAELYGLFESTPESAS